MHLSSRFAADGFEVAVIEDRPHLQDVILGRDGRDEQIDAITTRLRTMGPGRDRRVVLRKFEENAPPFKAVMNPTRPPRPPVFGP